MVEILITLFGMTFTKPLNGSNSSNNEVHPSLILVYPILFTLGWTNNFFSSQHHQSNQQLFSGHQNSNPSTEPSQTQATAVQQSQGAATPAFDPSQGWPGSKLAHSSHQSAMTAASWGGIGHFHPAATKMEMGSWGAGEVGEGNSGGGSAAASSALGSAQGSSAYAGMNEMLGHSFAPAAAGGLPAAAAVSSAGSSSYGSAASASVMALAATAAALPHQVAGSGQSGQQEFKMRV